MGRIAMGRELSLWGTAETVQDKSRSPTCQVLPLHGGNLLTEWPEPAKNSPQNFWHPLYQECEAPLARNGTWSGKYPANGVFPAGRPSLNGLCIGVTSSIEEQSPIAYVKKRIFLTGRTYYWLQVGSTQILAEAPAQNGRCKFERLLHPSRISRVPQPAVIVTRP